MHAIAWMLLPVLAGGPALSTAAPAADPGSAVDGESWARWQGRLTLGVPTPDRRPMPAGESIAPAPPASLLGDYYFARIPVRDGTVGGFRATSGLVVGPRGSLATLQYGGSAGSRFSIGTMPLGRAAAVLPQDLASERTAYVGFGYTGSSTRDGWGFSADLGWAAPGAAARLGRALGASQGVDEAFREMRLRPVVQLGVSYAF